MADPVKLSKLFKWERPELTDVKTFMCGIECEIESVRGTGDMQVSEWFTVENDHSLRNHGIEFISHPCVDLTVMDGFQKLHANISYYEKEDAFSPRTSTHVHVNCRTLNSAELHQMMLFYALYEEIFFAMVKPERRDNIHCVPLTETFLPAQYRLGAPNLIKRWHKYTAFNLCPLTTKGTVEFRHLQGTDDAFLLNDWLTSLRALWNICQSEVIDDKTVSDPVNHYRWFDKLFGHSEAIRAMRPALENKISGSLLDVKLALV
jgi:hypothetical protein